MLVNADFPRKKINLPPKTIVQQNEWLAEKYNPTGSFPFTLLLDKEGKVLKRWDGKPEESANDFVQVIKSFYKQAY